MVAALPIFFGPCTLGRTWGTRRDFGIPVDSLRAKKKGALIGHKEPAK
jgi:hypothetical protein